MSGWVYFIREGADGPIKIGFTDRNPTGRLNSLQHGNSRPLQIIGMVRADGRPSEGVWHARFSAFRLEREWFSAHASLLQAIKTECLTGARLEKVVERYRRGDRPIGPKLRALHAWMSETGRTIESLAAEIGWQEKLVRSAVLGRNRSDSLGMYIAAAIAGVSSGRFKIADLHTDCGWETAVHRRLLNAEAARSSQAVSA